MRTYPQGGGLQCPEQKSFFFKEEKMQITLKHENMYLVADLWREYAFKSREFN